MVSETGLVTPVGPGVSAIGLTSGAASTSITALVLEPDSLTFTSLGVRHQLLAEVPGANGPLAQITWTSADESIVNIDDENQKAISESVGTTQVTGQFIYNDQTYSQLLHVTVQQIPVFFDIHEDTLELTAIGETLEIGIETRDSAGSMLDDLDIIDWVSSDPGVATADTQIVTAVSGGFTTVYAVYGDVIDSVVVHVDQWTETITVSPDSVHFTATGDTLTVAAQAFDYLEHLIPNAPIEWTTSDSSVVIAHPEGLLEATGAGAAQVTATLDDGLAVVQVVDSP